MTLFTSTGRTSIAPIAVPLCGLAFMLVVSAALMAAGQTAHAIGLLPYLLLLVGPLVLLAAQRGSTSPSGRVARVFGPHAMRNARSVRPPASTSNSATYA
ncbi:MAG: DUF2933 domain-containing protein [Myxococcales bacterium]|nr:DUF2933 domain-containing protein [Myxococcales bacterium]